MIYLKLILEEHPVSAEEKSQIWIHISMQKNGERKYGSSQIEYKTCLKSLSYNLKKFKVCLVFFNEMKLTSLQKYKRNNFLQFS